MSTLISNYTQNTRKFREIEAELKRLLITAKIFYILAEYITFQIEFKNTEDRSLFCLLHTLDMSVIILHLDVEDAKSKDRITLA